jgi:hypothetical protein
MDRRYLLLAILSLLIGTLACGTFSDSTEPTITPTIVATPTLAPTATIDPNVTPFGQATDIPATVEDGSVSGTEDATTEADNPQNENQSGENATPANGDSSNDNSNGGAAASACPTGGQNLLTNPSFEGEFKPFGAFEELNHAPNWFPWWQDGASNLRPEFKPADISVAPNRVHGGSKAQQYFKSFGQFKAGLYQSVLNVTPGSRVQFSAHGQAWSCEEFNMCPGGTSVNPANMLMRVGIDPTGDTDWSADTIVWSEYFNPLDQWQIACAEAVADRDIVTVWLWASPDGPRQNQDIYWDDATLVVMP